MLKYLNKSKKEIITLKEFYSMISKDQGVMQILLNYGLISREDLRVNLVGDENSLECDSDLENEIQREKLNSSEEEEKLKLGYELDSDEVEEKK
jgi:hypothetical protein